MEVVGGSGCYICACAHMHTHRQTGAHINIYTHIYTHIYIVYIHNNSLLSCPYLGVGPRGVEGHVVHQVPDARAAHLLID